MGFIRGGLLYLINIKSINCEKQHQNNILAELVLNRFVVSEISLLPGPSFYHGGLLGFRLDTKKIQMR
jgi:hypothetical protein